MMMIETRRSIVIDRTGQLIPYRGCNLVHLWRRQSRIGSLSARDKLRGPCYASMFGSIEAKTAPLSLICMFAWPGVRVGSLPYRLARHTM